MSQKVAQGASLRDVIDAVNMLAGKLSYGRVTLEAGTSTVISNPNIGPQSLIVISSLGQVAGIGEAVVEHASEQGGQEVAYVVINP